MSPRQRKVTRFAVSGAALLAVALGLWLMAGRAGASGTGDWAEVRRDDLVVGVPVAGTLSSVQAVRIGPPQIAQIWDYKISFMAPEGAPVRPGEPVLGFDTSELERQLLDKRAERDSAEKELEKKQTDLEIDRRDRELELAEAEARLRKASLKVDVPPELVASRDLAKSREDLALAHREVAYLNNRLHLDGIESATEIDALARKRDRAAVRVQEMENAIGRMTVTAPRAGTVVYVATDDGEKKKVGDSCWRGQSVLEIPDLRRMEAEGEIDEADAGRVTAGQRVTFRLDAHPDDVFTGRVRSIGGSVQSRSDTDALKVVKLEIDLDSTDAQRMRPGMRFLGTVEIERIAKALVVPAEAVFNRGSGPVVYRKNGWGSEEVRPTLGQRNDRQVEIRSGLKLGDRVSRRELAESR
ncbi:MAG TPA: HlyD family efflux transporter periplasmic adaptor subunit [Thermoanaerobaculia bacterium]|jgi:multidrug efflux pump subunit AcrA (membrane-fusion protein)|nr:HlyD family efflux transporter periplasmic adaptor subunit [Thermoanaerobaculia bacterium]